MNNIINKWSYDKPTEPGDYLTCYGDVEVSENILFERFSNVDGQLQDELGYFAIAYGSHIKFARLVYSPTEIKEIESED